MCAHCFAVTDNGCFVRAFRLVGASTLHAAYGRVVCTDDIVFPVYLVEMMSFSHSVAFRDNNLLTPFHIAAEIGLKLNQPYLVVTMYGIYFVVIVKQYSQIVNSATHVFMYPGTGRVFGGKHL